MQNPAAHAGGSQNDGCAAVGLRIAFEGGDALYSTQLAACEKKRSIKKTNKKEEAR
jgi:hypothetical protein